MTRHPYAAKPADLVDAKYAHVVGNPAKHSLSPKLHNAAYRHLNLPYQYSILEVTESECIAEIEKLRDGEVFGLSFTMPYKELAFSIAEEVTDTVKLTEAVNTLVYRDGKIVGENTDVVGIKNSIGSEFTATEPWTVIGTGATSRSAIAALLDLGAIEIWAVGRNDKKLNELEERFGISVAHYGNEFPTTNVISTIPEIGQGSIIDQIRDPRFVLDVNYWPWPTKLASALGQDVILINGLNMLVHQAVLQLEIMVGQQVPAEVLFSALT